MDTIINHWPSDYQPILEWARALSPIIGLALIAFAIIRTSSYSHAPLIEINGKTFRNERIVVDGKIFIKCTFHTVTLVFNGGQCGLKENKFFGTPVLSTDRKDFALLIEILKKMDFLNAKVVDGSGLEVRSAVEHMKPNGR